MSKNKEHYDCIVIGGGPAGMMAAGRAAELGARVLLLEKNPMLGKKLSITGGGRCNITNAEFDTKKFLENFPQAKKFLYSPFSKHSVQDTFDFFERQKLPLVIEARKRAFPESQSAEDVTKTMVNYVKKNNVTIKLKTKVRRLLTEDTRIVGVETSKGTYHADHIILASGGAAVSQTGSTGDGFSFLRDLGHTIKEPNPNIVPLTTDARWIHELSGTTLSFMTISFIQNHKTHVKKTGKILFTHFGISGPLILNSAYEVVDLLRYGPVTASIDMFPDTEFKDIEKRVFNLFERNKNKDVKNVFPEIAPKGLSDTILSLPHIDLMETKVHSVTKEKRKALIHALKDLQFPITGTMDLDWAVIADGGVTPEEVDFTNMTSRLYPNLYLIGDVLNINRPSGGYSLQLCWTTGWVAGESVGVQGKN